MAPIYKRGDVIEIIPIDDYVVNNIPSSCYFTGCGIIVDTNLANDLIRIKATNFHNEWKDRWVSVSVVVKNAIYDRSTGLHYTIKVL